MVREVTGVQRVQTLRSRWIPVTKSNPALVNIGNHAGALIDAAGEYAYIEIQLPFSFTSVEYFYFVFVSANAGTVDMRFQVDADWTAGGGAYNANTYSGVLDAAATLNQLDARYLHAQITPLASEQVVGLKISYAAAGNGDAATNAYILGAAIGWY